MEVVLTIYRIISTITLIYGAYYVVTSILGLSVSMFNKKAIIDYRKEHKFAIIIPARNEETVIGNLIDSLKNAHYNKDKYDIYVVINNTTDNTKKVVKKHGGIPLNCTNPVKTKADVLKFAFDYLKTKKDIDAYLIFDADNVVHPDFLKNMNKALNNGYRVATGFRDAKNPYDSWISCSYTVFYYIQFLFFCTARAALNANATVTGTGFMIKKDLIDEDGFNTYSLTEDLEFTGQCALKGEKIYYAYDAITYDEYPVSFKTSWKQRKRWSVGNLQCMRLYFFKLIGSFFRKPKISKLDMAFNFSGVFTHALVYINLFMFRIANFIQGNPLIEQDYLSWIIRYLVQISIPLFVLIFMKRNPFKYWKGILLFPLFILTWLPINIICLFKKDLKWEEIKHDRSIKLEEIKVK